MKLLDTRGVLQCMTSWQRNKGLVLYNKQDVIVTNGYVLLVYPNGVDHPVIGLHNEIMRELPKGGTIRMLLSEDVSGDSMIMDKSGRWTKSYPDIDVDLRGLLKLVSGLSDTGGNDMAESWRVGDYITARGDLARGKGGKDLCRICYLPTDRWSGNGSVRWVGVQERWMKIVLSLKAGMWAWDRSGVNAAMRIKGPDAHGWVMPLNEDGMDVQCSTPPPDDELLYWEEAVDKNRSHAPTLVKQLAKFVSFGDEQQQAHAAGMITNVCPETLTFGTVVRGDRRINEQWLNKNGEVLSRLNPADDTQEIVLP